MGTGGMAEAAARKPRKADQRRLWRVATSLYVSGPSPKSGSWIFLFRSPLTGRRREMGLGPLELVTRARAKELALAYRLALLQGRDPLAEREAEEARRKAEQASRAPTFREAYGMFVDAHEKSWRNPKHRWQWVETPKVYVFPVLGDVAVDRIATADVLRVLQPIWHSRTETASRLRSRIETVLNFCAVRGWRSGANPAAWRGNLQHVLPSPKKSVVHHAAVAWRDLPRLYQKLAGQADVSALALRYVVLTLLRTTEVIRTPAAGEINRPARMHVIPASRMKAKREHRVPLGDEALHVIAQAEERRAGEYLFASPRGGLLSDMALLQKLRGIVPGTTVHGLRSSFRDWCSEHGVPRELAERQLAHRVADAVEAAYLRTDAFDPRRQLMARWEAFLLAPVSEQDADVVHLDAVRAAQ